MKEEIADLRKQMAGTPLRSMGPVMDVMDEISLRLERLCSKENIKVGDWVLPTDDFVKKVPYEYIPMQVKSIHDFQYSVSNENNIALWHVDNIRLATSLEIETAKFKQLKFGVKVSTYDGEGVYWYHSTGYHYVTFPNGRCQKYCLSTINII